QYLPKSLSYLPARWPPSSTLFPYTTLFRSCRAPLMSLRERVEALAAQKRERYDEPERTLFAEFRAALTRGEIRAAGRAPDGAWRSEEHTSELQSRGQLVCRLLLAKKTRRTA